MEIAFFCSRNFNTVERWHSGKYAPIFNQRTHVFKEQGKDQAANVRAINISIRHQNDSAIARLFEVK